MKNTGVIAIALLLTALAGCGTGIAAEFPNRLVGADGQHFVLEDLRAIAEDPDLSDEQKRQAFRDLGIDEEKLIEALLAL